MGAPVLRPFEQSSRSESNIRRSGSVYHLALPSLLLAVALIGYAISHPDVAKWVAEAVQAEFAGAELAPVASRP